MRALYVVLVMVMVVLVMVPFVMVLLTRVAVVLVQCACKYSRNWWSPDIKIMRNRPAA
jgi:hypothetical protein